MLEISLRLNDLRKFKGSLVYQLIRNGQVLYVGRSNVGIDRPLEKFHYAMSQAINTDLVKLTFCKDASSAAKLEKRLIHTHNPPFNRRKPEHRVILMGISQKGGMCP